MSCRAARILAAVIVLALAAGPAAACDTPVFRVAMFDPRWKPHPYEITIVRYGPLGQRAEQKMLQRLDDLLDNHPKSINYTLVVVDLHKQGPADLRDIFKVRRGPTAWPQLALAYPAQTRLDTNVWSGPLRDAPLYELLYSPARAELARRLIAGETGVWVLIESGDKGRDDAAFAVLSGELQQLQKTAELSEAGPGGKKIAIPDWAPPAKIAFSVLRLSRADPAERWFIAMLMGLESDLESYAGQPIAFAVFGRGNTLEPLVGKGITAANLRKDVQYLTGPCVCEEKALNPVKDLLMMADWDNSGKLPALAQWFAAGVPVEDQKAAPTPADKVAAPTPRPQGEPPGTSRQGGLLESTVVKLAAGVVVLALVGAVLVRLKRVY
jgi:hypothetical protein